MAMPSQDVLVDEGRSQDVVAGCLVCRGMPTIEGRWVRWRVYLDRRCAKRLDAKGGAGRSEDEQALRCSLCGGGVLVQSVRCSGGWPASSWGQRAACRWDPEQRLVRCQGYRAAGWVRIVRRASSRPDEGLQSVEEMQRTGRVVRCCCATARLRSMLDACRTAAR